MAEIFVARVSGLPGFEKIVVVKRILPQLATNQEFIQMFLDEARIAATLHHPNIVQMYDIGAVDGNYFISMEYLHGEDVRTLMKTLRSKGEGLPLEHALNVVIGLASGLHYAHEKVGFDGKALGIVHRDVNPQNVFITYDGGIKIVDFGIAKATNRFNETRYGTLKGKIPYMSPEQCRSEGLDRRSDVYAIGIMLYELTTGYRLYKGRSEFEILKKIVEEGVTQPSLLRPGYPKELERIVLKALAKDKNERYQSAQDLQADLEAFARHHRLTISSIALSAFMQKVFGNKIEAWREAQAAGKDLAEHIAERGEPSLPGRNTSGEMEALSDEDVQEVAPEEVEEVHSGGTPTPAAQGEMAPAETAGGKRRWVAAVGVVAVVAGAAVAFAVWKGDGKGGTHQAAAAKASGGAEGEGTGGMGGAAGIGAGGAGTAGRGGDGAGGAAGIGGAGAAGQGGGGGPGGAAGQGGDGTTAAELGAGAAAGVSDPRGIGPPTQAAAGALGGATESPAPVAGAGIAKIISKPAGAHVFVDGKEWRERTPAVVDGLAPGEHSLKLELSGHETYRGRFKVAANETKDVALDLKPHGGAALAVKGNGVTPPLVTAAAEGELRIASSPSCEVIVDGKARGSTPLAGLKLAPGNHSVQLVNSRFGIDRSFTVEVRSGEVTKKKYDFPVTPN